MCRYIDYPVKSHNVCFNCRVSVKQGGVGYCPHCGEPLIRLGEDLKTPKKNNDAQWKKLELLVENGYMFSSCGCSGPGYRPKTYAEAKRFINNKQY